MEFVNNFVEERITMFWGMKTVHVSWKNYPFSLMKVFLEDCPSVPTPREVISTYNPGVC